MFSIFIRLLCTATGVAAFYCLSVLFNRAYDPDKPVLIYNRGGFLIAGFLLGLLLAPYVEEWLLGLHKQVLKSMQRFSPHALASGFIGLLMGFFFSILITFPIWIFMQQHRALSLTLTIVSCVVFGYLGVVIFSRVSLWGGSIVSTVSYRTDAALPKVLDTSVLIDGRIFDLCSARLIEGKIIIPDIVVNELQGIAGDADAVRRKRGRRGLDIVAKIKALEDVELEVIDMPAPRAGESNTVDSRLTNYAKAIGGILVTNDFNLTKVAELRGVRVYNLNVLARALRKTVLPGERIEVSVVKVGKEHGQGIAYLDDGTMIVIESGEKSVGDNVAVEINSIMQTVAGRLIFAKIVDGGLDEISKHDRDMMEDI